MRGRRTWLHYATWPWPVYPLPRGGPGSDLAACVEAELVSDLLDVVFSRPHGDEQPGSDTAVAHPLGHQARDLRLALSEWARGRAHLALTTSGRRRRLT